MKSRLYRKIRQAWQLGYKRNRLEPQEYIADTWAMANMNMIIHIVEHTKLKKNDYDISPIRYIHTAEAETYRPIAEIVQELGVIEAEARRTDAELRKILDKIGIPTEHGGSND